MICSSRGIAGLMTGALLTAAGAAAAAPGRIEGTVLKVFDGDSVLVQPVAPARPSQAQVPVQVQAQVQVRLQNIDAPEICQNWGRQSREALAELVLNKTVAVQTVGRDVHGRVLGLVRVDGNDVGTRMVEEGHAWSVRSRWDRGPLVKQERMARSLARGLHSEGRPMMPKDFRASNGPCPH